MFEGMLKHTGQLNNTGKNVVVVFMQLPEDNDHALVIDTDALPDMFNESLRRVVESVEAQQSKNLADVLARRMSPDGSGTTLLQKFHQGGRLMKTPVSNVTMVPRRGVRWPLSDVIAAMGSQEDSLPANFDELDPETKAAIAAEVKKFNVHATNQENQSTADRSADAKALLEMARLLESDAMGKREQAYRMDPSLRPKTKAVQDQAVAAETITESVDHAAVETKTKTSAKKPAKKAAA
jgi:Fe2+ transport system protein B